MAKSIDTDRAGEGSGSLMQSNIVTLMKEIKFSNNEHRL